MLSTCSGLRGLLQFQNVTYGIEPMESAQGFQHIIYQTNYDNSSFPLSAESYHIKSSTALIQKINIGVPKAEMAVYQVSETTMGLECDHKVFNLISAFHLKQANFSTQRYLEMHVVVAKALYDFLGSKVETVTEKIIQLINFINAMFFKLNTKIILSSLEFWTDKDKIHTTKNMNELLQRFTEWKYSHLSLRPHDITFLFMQASGVKAFSSCSVKDFQSFLAHGQGQCLLNKPHLNLQYKAPSCGNGVVEDGEQCDCGTNTECIRNGCCQNCRFKTGKVCAQGACCWEKRCQIKAKGTLCRDLRDPDCDLKEYCNGTSPECTEDFYIQDGQLCEGHTGVCMSGVCQSPDRWCRKVFGKASKSGLSQCYEEINSQSDRMGHCGSSATGYQKCQWQDLRCGKLVCEYPYNKPFMIENAAVIYARVQNRWCVTLDYQKGTNVKDPFLVHDGAGCGQNKFCLNQKCMDYATIKPSCDAARKCNKNGECNNKGNCHCHKGWAPPTCKTRETGGLGGSIDSTFRSASLSIKPRTVSVSTRNWLLVCFFLFLPILIASIVLIVKVRQFLSWRRDEEAKDEEDEEGKDDEERRSQGANPTGVTR
ncbi:UNVERIFIED_CONTAM: hypothetical protein K2H54_035762 [Gekko kuhli]